MHQYLLSILLGIIEGLTEYLPVSSTAHLRIAEALLGIDLRDGYWKMFSIVIQLGAILCLPIYFRKRILAFAQTFPTGTKGDRTFMTHPLTLTLIAFVCTAGPSYLLAKVIGKHLESLILMGSALIIGGIVMWVIDAVYGAQHAGATEAAAAEEIERMTIGQAIWVGLCQILSAVFPGTSRSMATIAAGQTSGLSRTAALEFSFLLSIPTMAAATGYDLFRWLKPPKDGVEGVVGRTQIDPHGWVLLSLGFVVSFLVALAVVAWFMHWVRRRGFTPFAIYRLLAGAGVLVWVMAGR